MCKFLSNLFQKKSQPVSSAVDVKTAPLSEEQMEAAIHEEKLVRPAQFQVGIGQSVGMQRDHNEDTLYAMNMMLANGTDDIPFGIFIVADGMGGHQHGEIASITAVRSVSRYLINHVYDLYLGFQSEDQTESLQEIMEAAVAEAQSAVTRKAPGGGTTMTAAVLIGNQLTIAHVGDSRAYLISMDGKMQCVTQDHSLVQRLLELGQISEEEARTHPQKNVLYRAVGQSDPLRSDVKTHQMPRPGYLLICSDGLWGVVDEQEIYRIIRSSENPNEACQKLVEAANQNGGPDNISAVLVYFPR